MQAFHYMEIGLYIFPILEIILINRFFRSYLTYKNKIHFSVAQVVLPLLLVGIHLLGKYIFNLSILPYFLFAVFLLGLIQTAYFDFKKKKYSFKIFVDFYTKIMFLLGIVLYYFLVIYRIYTLLRG